MNDFRFADLGRVYWPATAKVAVARGFAAGLVFLVLNLVMSGASQINIAGMLTFPFGMAIFAIPIGLFCHMAGKIAGMFIPLLGAFFSIVGSLIVCMGDPLVYLVNRQFPQLLDVADFGFFNFTPLLFITHPE